MIYFKLLRRFLQLAIARETQYRANFLALSGVGLIETIVTILPMLLLFSFTDSLDGWTQGEAIALVGLYRIAISIYEFWAGNGVLGLSSAVESGDLDLLLIRPVNAQFLVTFRYVTLFQLVNMLIGVVVFAIGATRSDFAVSWQSAVQTLFIFACGLVLLSVIISAGSYISFRATTVQQLPWVVIDIAQMGQYPISFYPGAVRSLLTIIVPVAFVTTIPINALRGSVGWGTVGLAIVFAAASLVALRWWWNNSVRHYASASS